MISGYATPKGTQEFLRNFSSLQQVKNELSGLSISAGGFGTYRTTISNNSHRQSLLKAITNGVNLIDTSSNYGDGGSEELVGSVIEELINAKTIQRESIIKNLLAYLNGANYEPLFMCGQHFDYAVCEAIKRVNFLKVTQGLKIIVLYEEHFDELYIIREKRVLRLKP